MLQDDTARRIARESREIASLLYTRSRCLQDHLAQVMGLICRYDALIHELADLGGEPAHRLLRRHLGRLRSWNRDDLLAEMMRTLERSACESSDLEELASTLEAIGSEGAHGAKAPTSLEAWTRRLAAQVETLTRGRLQCRWRSTSAARGGPAPQGAMEGLASAALRCLAEQTPGPGRLRGVLHATPDGLQVRATLLPQPSPRGAGRWHTLPDTATPPPVRVVDQALRERRGRLSYEVWRGSGEPAEAVRIPIRLTLRLPSDTMGPANGSSSRTK